MKYDGYRLRLERNGDRVRLITRGGYDWTKRFPWIVEAGAEEPAEAFRHGRLGGDLVRLARISERSDFF
jgi:ATP-dependent DNA ligase